MHVVRANSGLCIASAGQVMHVKLPASLTNGEVTVIEGTIPPNDGPPLHVHLNENETYYVLEGVFEFECGNDIVHGGQGTFLFAPRGVPHRYRNIGENTGRILFGFTPGGIEHFFLQISKEHNRQRKSEIALGFGITMLG